MKVRDSLPQRREEPTLNPTGKSWSQHKPDLRNDFNQCCGYCGSFDGFRHTYFEVDHFVPKSLFERNNNISYCQYDNLVYSCKFCNNKKLAKWPSDDEAVHNANEEGFVDPCLEEYDEHLYRTSEGSILWKSNLGKWMATEAFGFDERDYSIKLLWNINQIRKSIETLVDFLSEIDEGSEEYNEIKSNAEKFSFEYFKYHSRLMDFYNG